MESKQKIEDWIGCKRVTLLFAATTGWGVQPFLEFARKHDLRIIVVTAHKIGNPRWKPFNSQIKKEIEHLGGVIVHERAFWAVQRIASMIIKRFKRPLFGYKQQNWEELLAGGGRICLQITAIAIKENLINQDETVIAIAGTKTALAFKITNTRPPKMALLDIIFRPDIKLLRELDKKNWR